MPKDDQPIPDIEELSQRFLKLWQDQLRLMAGSDVPPSMTDDWMAHWQGMMQGGMPMMQPGAMQKAPMEYLASLIPGALKGGIPAGNERAKDELDDSTKAGTSAQGGAAPTSVASVNYVGILEQLTSHLERLDQRLTKLEQESVSPKSSRKSSSTGRRSTKKPQAKSKYSARRAIH